MTNSNLTKNTFDTDLDALLSLIDQYQVVVVEVAVVFILHRSLVVNKNIDPVFTLAVCKYWVIICDTFKDCLCLQLKYAGYFLIGERWH